MEFNEVIKNRYSVRSFNKDKEVEEYKLEEILKAGMVAPTAKNGQPQKVYILKSEEAIKKIEELTPCTYNAPVALLICYDKNLIWNNPFCNFDSGIEDASIVCTHMMLEATNVGLGSCWVNFFDYEKIKNVYNLPDNIMPVALLAIGYPTEDSKPNEVTHFKSKKNDEVYTEL